jgi:predicted alpha/beta-hydrolase family hydrolase
MSSAHELKFPVFGSAAGTVSEMGDVSALLLVPPKASCLYVFAHGAGAGMRHPFMEAAAMELANAGIATFRYQFPYMEQGRGAPDRPPVLTATVRAAVTAARESAPDLPLFAGGKSMGGRMTSQAAAEKVKAPNGDENSGGLDGVHGLIFFGFPLHPPKQPAIKRAEHLHRVTLPMLFLQGTRDDLADLTLLKPLCEQLGDLATLHILEGADHSFHVLKRSGTTDAEVLHNLAETVRSWTAGILKP